MSEDLKSQRIELTQGRWAHVSMADFDALSASRWGAVRCGGRWYVRRNGKHDGKRVGIYMHRQIFDLHPGDAPVVDHINGDGLDNRRENLRVVTASENNMNRQAAYFKSGPRGVYRQHGKYIVRVAKEYVGCFETEPEAAYAANLLIDELSPGIGFRNSVDFQALIQTLRARREAADLLLQQVMEAARNVGG